MIKAKTTNQKFTALKCELSSKKITEFWKTEMCFQRKIDIAWGYEVIAHSSLLSIQSYLDAYVLFLQ